MHSIRQTCIARWKQLVKGNERHIQRHIHKYVYAIYIHIHIYARIPKERENMLRVRGQESWAGTMLIGSSHGSSKSTSLGSRKSCSIMPRTIGLRWSSVRRVTQVRARVYELPKEFVHIKIFI